MPTTVTRACGVRMVNASPAGWCATSASMAPRVERDQLAATIARPALAADERRHDVAVHGDPGAVVEHQRGGAARAFQAVAGAQRLAVVGGAVGAHDAQARARRALQVRDGIGVRVPRWQAQHQRQHQARRGQDGARHAPRGRAATAAGDPPGQLAPEIATLVERADARFHGFAHRRRRRALLRELAQAVVDRCRRLQVGARLRRGVQVGDQPGLVGLAERVGEVGLDQQREAVHGPVPVWRSFASMHCRSAARARDSAIQIASSVLSRSLAIAGVSSPAK